MVGCVSSLYRGSRWFLVAAMLLLVCGGTAQADGIQASNPFAGKQVLLLNSYSEGFGGYEEIVKGVFDGVVKAGGRIDDLQSEKLDLIRFPGKAYKQSLVDMLRVKYGDRKIDLIITIQPPALDFALNEGQPLFRGVPIIAAFVHENLLLRVAPPSNVVFLPYRLDFTGTVDYARQMFPDTRRVVLVGGIGETDRTFVAQAQRDFAARQDNLVFEYLIDGDYAGTLKRVAALPPDSIILLSTFYRDKDGRAPPSRDVMQQVLAQAKVPAFSLWDSLKDMGMVGGSVLPLEVMGRQVAAAASDYLSGRKTLDDLRHLPPVAGVPTFDWRQIEHWHGNTRSLPEHTVYLNRPPTLWGDFRKTVVATAVALALLFGLIFALVLANQRRMIAEARFRTMLESAPEAIIVTDADDFSWVAVNPKISELTGYSPDELRSMPLQALFAEQLPANAEADAFRYASREERTVAYRERVMNGEEMLLERFIRRKDGTEVVCEIRVVRLPDPSRRLLRYSLVDITSRKQIEARLRASEATFRNILETISLVGVALDGNGRIILCNDYLLALTGWQREEVIDQSWFDLFIPNDDERNATQEMFRTALASGEMPEHFEGLIVTRQGGRHLIAWSNTLLRDADERVVGVASIGEDVTERRQAEQILRSERDFSQLVINRTPAFYVAIDFSGRVITMNDTMREALGCELEAVIGQDYLSRFVPEGERETMSDAFNLMFEQRQNTHLENHILASNGRMLLCEWHGAPVVRGGSVAFIIGLAIDITARRKAEEEVAAYHDHLEELVAERTHALAEALGAAESANRAKSAFLSNMSHELRTPLNAVIGFSRLMGHSTHLDESEKRNLEIINRSGNHLLTLINEVLELSKIEAGHVRLAESPTDVAELAREVVDMLRPRAEQGGLELTLAISGAPGALRVDTMKLRQILINLLSNAIKFTPRGSVALTLKVISQGVGATQIEFAVRDTGIGISPADQERICEPFVQVVTHATTAGTGLGLTITRQYLRMLGSELKVESVPGDGATFSFILSLQEARGNTVVREGKVVWLDPVAQGKRVLVVEDNADARLLLVQLLTPLGFDVADAEDGLAAVARTKTFRPELIIMDWRMPRLDGLEATRRIRALPLAAQPKILMLTASAFEEQRQHALAAGIDDFLRKPLQEHELFDALEKMLDIRFQREAPESDRATANAEPLTVEALAVLTAEQCNSLRVAIEELNRNKLNLLLTQVVADHPGLARSIAHMADSFRYQELWGLIADRGVGR